MVAVYSYSILVLWCEDTRILTALNLSIYLFTVYCALSADILLDNASFKIATLKQRVPSHKNI